MIKTFGKYRFVEQLASSAVSSTYLAHPVAHPQQRVVVKLFAASDARHLFLNADLSSRIAALKQLKHTYLLPIIESGYEQDFLYLATAYAPNRSLADSLFHVHNHFSLHETLKIVFQVGQALAYIHERGFVHGNIKPGNILFDADHEVQLTDFNLAALVGDASVSEKQEKNSCYYMAPEQFAGMVNPASDQYALACVAYELLTGQPPFRGASWSAMRAKHTNEPLVPPRELRPDLPVHINAAIIKALAKDPAARYENTYAFISALNVPLEKSAATSIAEEVVVRSGETPAGTAAEAIAEAETFPLRAAGASSTVAARGSGKEEAPRSHFPTRRPSRSVQWFALAAAILIVALTVVTLHTFVPSFSSSQGGVLNDPAARVHDSATVPVTPTNVAPLMGTVPPSVSETPASTVWATEPGQGEPTATSTAPPAVQSKLLAVDDFDGSAGPVQGQNTGSGWSGGWSVQNGNTNIPGYTIGRVLPLSYPGLQSSPDYLSGGKLTLSAGRTLNTDSGGPFEPYLQNGLIGRPGTTLWVSALMRKDQSTNENLLLALHRGSSAWCADCASSPITFGYLAANTDTQRYWTLSLAGTTTRSSRPIEIGRTYLLVLRIDFGSTTTVRLYVNPTPGGDAPASEDALLSSSVDLSISQLAFYAGDDASQGSIDEIRFGTSFAAVTPSA